MHYNNSLTFPSSGLAAGEYVAPVDETAVWQALDTVTDPEIPVITVVELGIIQGIAVGDKGIAVTITPTFSGCPALDLIRCQIADAVIALGVPPEQVSVRLKLSPAWTSERITEEGRRKLKEIGLAPPQRVPANGGIIALDSITLADGAACPFCDSHHTTLENPFGPTMCRSLYYCNDCKQPFEQFKAL